ESHDLRGSRRLSEGGHARWQTRAVDVEKGLVDAGERFAVAILADARRSHGKQRVSRDRGAPRVRGNTRPVAWCGVRKYRHTIGHAETGLLQPRAVVCLRTGRRFVG